MQSREKIACPFCNFKTSYPEYGRVHDCQGECYATYILVPVERDEEKTKMRLVEIFFLDDEYNLRLSPHEIDKKCEFRTLPSREPGEEIVFARQKRVIEEDIELLKEATDREIEIGVGTLERLKTSLARFERNLQDNDYPRNKLINEIKVVETIAKMIKQKLELSRD